MKHAAYRWTIVAIAALVVGPLAGWLTGFLRASDGGPDATALTCDAPAVGILFTLAAILIAGAYGLIASKALNFKWGMLCAGLIVAWAAWDSGRADAILRRAQGPAPFIPLAIEGWLYAALAIVLSWLIVRASDVKLASVRDDGAKIDSWKAAAVGLAVGAAAAWGVARSEMVGQTFAAAAAAGALATLLGRVVGHRAVVPASVVPVMILAGAGPLIARFMHADHTIAALYKGDLFPLARIMPLDWIAGWFIGTAVGVSWAGSMVEKHAEPQNAALARA